MKKNINILNERDTYSLLLFCLYKVKELPEYSTLSELVYILDKDNMLKFCEYFGGTTITVPTIEELQLLLYALLLYQYVDIDKISYEKAISQIGCKSSELRAVKAFYSKLKTVLDSYSFNV